MSDIDVLVGLRFELSGGLGKMAGEIVGRAGGLYLVQRDGADFLELMELTDLRSAKFYGKLSRQSQSGATVTTLSPVNHAKVADDTGKDAAAPRLSEKIRRSASAHGDSEAADRT